MFLVPLEVENPCRHKPAVIWGIIGLNTMVFALGALLFDRSQLVHQYGLIPAHYSALTVMTSMFLHGGVLHLLGNMAFLYMFGDNVEDVIGGLWLLLAYLICGLGATSVYLWLHPDSVTPCIGASGAISGMAGMYLVFFPRVKAELCLYFFRWEIDRFTVTVLGAIGAWFAEQLVLTILVELTEAGNVIRVAFSAHLGGFLTGVVLGTLFFQFGFLERYLSKGKRHWLLGNVG